MTDSRAAKGANDGKWKNNENVSVIYTWGYFEVSGKVLKNNW